jgi:hypothetical protein
MGDDAVVPKVDGGRLKKAVQEVSLAVKSVHFLLHRINSCKTSKMSAQASKYVV